MTEQELHIHRDELIAYLQVKVRAQDWHAVQDAASDIREIDAQLEFIRQQRESRA